MPPREANYSPPSERSGMVSYRLAKRSNNFYFFSLSGNFGFRRFFKYFLSSSQRSLYSIEVCLPSGFLLLRFGFCNHKI
ncbi:MAG: hypothetical protein LBC74_08880 [Planctomycetaceae bacterium]|jgi:hypothetical protein|nr:hypothetical protein [Planctomycetaceae bacterium]